VKKIVGGLKGSEDETCIRVESRVLLGANPRKSCNQFLNNYKAEFGLKQHLICSGTFLFFISLINPQLTSLYCNFSYGSKKGPAKYFSEREREREKFICHKHNIHI